MEELSPREIERYHRQILLSELGLDGQRKLKSAKVLVIGAGGLGSPCLLYLAGAGIGTIGIIDNDTVETINLHRQVLHMTPSVGQNKAESAAKALNLLNPELTIIPYPFALTPSISPDIIQSYDCIVTATDNLESRYLISDLGVFYKKPVVSASALRWEGQLSVFTPSPCFRCYFPEPTPRIAWSKASEIGVLGPVPGVLGTLQAVETIKLLLGLPVLSEKMLVYDGLSGIFRVFKMRGASEKCPACTGRLDPSGFDYGRFFGEVQRVPDVLEKGISPEELRKLIDSQNVDIVDLRNVNHYGVDHIQYARNVPYYEIEGCNLFDDVKPLVFVCRDGNDSARAVEHFTRKGVESSYLVGGLSAWKTMDPAFIQF